MSRDRRLHLGAFMRPVGIHTAWWRHSGGWPDANFNFERLATFALRRSAASTSGRFTTTASLSERTSTQCRGSSVEALISWCGTKGGTKMKSPGPASATYSSRSPQRIRARPETT